MTNAEFVENAFRRKGPKIVDGFSRPIFHNLAGLIYGRQLRHAEFGGMLRHTEAAMLYLWARSLPRHAALVEIGCYGGLSTLYIAKACQSNDATVFSIDPFASDLSKQESLTDHAVRFEGKPSRQTVLERLKRHEVDARVELIEGYSEQVVKTWNRPIHFLWIDGNHNQAYQDYEHWSPFLLPGGRIAFHDAHPRYGIRRVAEDVRRVLSCDMWTSLEHVKGIMTAVLKNGTERTEGTRTQ